MRSKLLAAAVGCGIWAAACSDWDDEGGGGYIGDGGFGGTSSQTSASGDGICEPCQVPPECDAFGCDGDRMDPASGCLECAVLGDETVAKDGGACLDDYVQCFGMVGDCSDAGNSKCCALSDCIQACPVDEPATAGVDEYLNCLCTNDGSTCTLQQTDAATCYGGPAGSGADDYRRFVACVSEVCTVSCGWVPPP